VEFRGWRDWDGCESNAHVCGGGNVYGFADGYVEFELGGEHDDGDDFGGAYGEGWWPV
jgi:hypothetical protein